MDKVSFNPRSIRGLGNIVSVKDVSDFGEYNSQLLASSADVNGRTMTVYESNYRKTEKIVLSYNGFVPYTDELLSFPVKATLYNSNGGFYVGRVLKCIVNSDMVLTGTTNSRGEVTFNVPVGDMGLYSFTVQYNVVNSGRVSGCDASGRVLVGDLKSIQVLSQHQIIQTGEDNQFLCTVEGLITENETIPVPDMPISFYEEYIISNLRLSSNKGHRFQKDDVVTFTARLSDEDGSAIPGELVSFYEEYEAGTLRITNTTPDIEIGDNLTFTARLTNAEGGLIQDETVKFYEEYTPTTVRLNPSMKLMKTGDNLTFTANIRDSDGSIIQEQGNIIKFFEEYELSNIRLSASSNSISAGDEVSLSARLSDEDGSVIPGQSVTFYEEFDYSELNVDAVPNPLIIGDEVTLSALLRDSDGSRVWGPEVYFTEPIDSTGYSMVLDVESDALEPGDEVDLSATVTDEEESPVEDVTVFFYADGDRLPEEIIVPAGTDSLTLTVDDDTINIGDSVTLTAVLTDLSTEPIEDEVVNFYDGTSLIGSDTTDENGTATYLYTPAVAGSLVLRAKSGDTSSNAVSVSVAKLSSTVSLSGSNITYGSNVALSGTLSVGSGESVKIYQGSNVIATVETTAGGAFSKSVSGLGAGSYTFKAVYDGNASYNGSNSSNVSITVSKATPTISLASSKASLVVGESFVLSGTLSVGTGQQVKIYQGSSVLDTVTTGSGGAFSKTINTATSGSFTYKAVFEGNSNYNSVTSSTVSVTVEEPSVPVSMTLTSDKSVLSYYDSEYCTLTATVLDDDDNPVPDWSVEFFNGSTSMGTRETNSSGVATIDYASTGAGDLTFKVTCDSGVSILQETYAIEDCLTALVTEGTITNSRSTKITSVGLDTIYNVQSTDFILEFDGYGNGTLNIGAKNQWSSSTANYRVTIGYADAKNYWSVRTTSTNEGYGSSASTTTWYKYRIEREGTTVRYYVDDTLIQTRTSVSFFSSYSTWSIYSIIWGSATQKYKNIKLKPL